MDTNDSTGPDASDTPELMYIRCATCGKWMDVKPGHITGVTHGICDDCFNRAMKRLDKEEGGPIAP